MTQYENLCDALNFAGIKYFASDFNKTALNWYKYPEHILSKAQYSILLFGGSGEFIFDNNGECIAEGSGDESGSYVLY